MTRHQKTQRVLWKIGQSVTTWSAANAYVTLPTGVVVIDANVDANSGISDIFVLKYDSMGNLLQ